MNTPRRSHRAPSIHFYFRDLFFMAASAYAGTLRGQVLDPDGRPIPGAQVLLLGNGATVRTAVTNTRGEFTIESPDSGRYELRVAVDGFRADPIVIDAVAGPRDLGPQKMAVSAVSESLVVSASQVEIPLSRASSAVTVITGSELQAKQIATVADALRDVPGLTVARSGGPGTLTTVFPRGGESDYTLVFIDGIQVNAFGGGFDFAHLSANNVDRIEIVRGPQSALYGSNAIGAVVRIVTRDGGPPRGGRVDRGGKLRHEPVCRVLLRQRERVVLGRRRGSAGQRRLQRADDSGRPDSRERSLRAHRGRRQRRLAALAAAQRSEASCALNTTIGASPDRSGPTPPGSSPASTRRHTARTIGGPGRSAEPSRPALASARMARSRGATSTARI